VGEICDDIVAARGAFRAAVGEWPDARLTLRHGIRVLEEHPKPGCSLLTTRLNER
jgi:hypothetical protein